MQGKITLILTLVKKLLVLSFITLKARLENLVALGDSGGKRVSWNQGVPLRELR